MLTELLEHPEKRPCLDGTAMPMSSGEAAEPEQDLARLVARWNSSLQALATAVAGKAALAESQGKGRDQGLLDYPLDLYAGELDRHRSLLTGARQLTVDLVEKTEACRRTTEELRRTVGQCTAVYESEKALPLLAAAGARTPLAAGFQLEPPTPSPYAAMIPSNPVTPHSNASTPTHGLGGLRSAEQRRVQLSVQREAGLSWKVREDALAAQHASVYGTPPGTIGGQTPSPSVRPWRAPLHQSKTPLQERVVPPTQETPTPTKGLRRPVASFMSKQEATASSVMDRVADDIVSAVVGDKENISALQYITDPMAAIASPSHDGFAARPKLANTPARGR